MNNNNFESDAPSTDVVPPTFDLIKLIGCSVVNEVVFQCGWQKIRLKMDNQFNDIYYELTHNTPPKRKNNQNIPEN